jgi:PAS domain S-box-containing protein
LTVGARTGPPGPGADRLRTLYEIGHQLSSSLELSVVLERVMDSLLQVTGAERGFIMLLDETGELAVRTARNLDQRTIEGQNFQGSRTLARRVLATAQPAVVTDALSDVALREAASVAAFQLRSILCAPLLVRGRPLGVVYVDNRASGDLFDEADLELLVAFSEQAAVAIENARLYEDLRQRAQQITLLKEYQDDIFRSVGSAIVAIDLEGTVTTFNQAAEAIFGCPAGEAVGRSHGHVLGSALAMKLFRPIARASRLGGEALSGLEVTAALPGRALAHLRVALSGLRDAEGRSQGVVLVVDDQTEARLAEQARERAEAAQRQIRDVFGRYVARSVVDRLLEDPSRVSLGGERQEITVLFADIRGYTTISEGLEPEQLVALLNEYLAVATAAIFEHEGTLDKYIGDAVMALFNTPLAKADHALSALRCAQAMQRALKRLATESGAPVAYGVGVNTGPAVVGNIGTEQLMNYTAIGDAVNVAARLQSNVPPGEVYFSGSTYALVEGAVSAERLEPLQVKGRQQSIEVYRLLEA